MTVFDGAYLGELCVTIKILCICMLILTFQFKMLYHLQRHMHTKLERWVFVLQQSLTMEKWAVLLSL